MKTTERKHRRWDYRSEPGLRRVAEHNALYDAWEQAEKEIERLHGEMRKSNVYNGELWRERHAETKRADEAEARVRELEAENDVNKTAAKLNAEQVQMGMEKIVELEGQLEAKQNELEDEFLKRIIPPGVPEPHRLARMWWEHNSDSGAVSYDALAGDTIDELEAEAEFYRNAVLAGIGPLLTREEVEKFADEEQRIGTEENDWESAFIGLRNRITARLPAALGAGVTDTPAVPSDEELYRLALQLGGMSAVREAIAAPLQAEIERLKSSLMTKNAPAFLEEVMLSMEEPSAYELSKEHDCDADLAGGIWEHAREYFRPQVKALEAERDSLREKLAAAEKESAARWERMKELSDRATRFELTAMSTPRPVTPRFTVTAEEMKREWSKCLASNTPPGEFSADPDSFLAAFSGYLAAHAVIDVPEGVPSAEELSEIHYEFRRKQNKEWEVMSWVEHREDHPDRHREYIGATQLLLDTLAPFLQPAAPEPIAAETLEQLADVLLAGMDGLYPHMPNSFEMAAPLEQGCLVNGVTAVLRAAKPEIDVDDLMEATSGDMSIADGCTWLNSRIRYRVEVPDDERVRVAAEDLVKEIENHRRIEWPTVDEWTCVVGSACSSALQNGVKWSTIREVARNIVARCDRLQDAALAGKDGE